MKRYLLALPLAFGLGALIAFVTTPRTGVAKTISYSNSCPTWICTPPPDDRTVSQYLAQCKPAQAYDPEVVGLIKWYCTDGTNPLDTPRLLPDNFIRCQGEPEGTIYTQLTCQS